MRPINKIAIECPVYQKGRCSGNPTVTACRTCMKNSKKLYQIIMRLGKSEGWDAEFDAEQEKKRNEEL